MSEICPPHIQFYIKDTKSSNGTFVNENRLSPSGEESGSVELKSRDILQFGVNVNVERRGIHLVYTIIPPPSLLTFSVTSLCYSDSWMYHCNH